MVSSVSTKSVLFSVFVSFVVVCSGRSYLQPSPLIQIGSPKVYNGLDLDQAWITNDEVHGGLGNYWTSFGNGLRRRHRVKRQQPRDKKAEFEAKIAILRQLGIIKPTSTIQQGPQPQVPQSQPQPAVPQPRPSVPQPQPPVPQPQPVAPQPPVPQPQPVAPQPPVPQPQPVAPQPPVPQPQPPVPQPQPVAPQPPVPQPQPVAPQPPPASPPPDTPALLPQAVNPQSAVPAAPPKPAASDAKPVPETQNPSPPASKQRPASKPQPTINPYLPVYPNRSYLNKPKQVSGEGPRPGPVPNQGIPAISTTPKPIAVNTTPINRQQPVVNQAQPKPVQYPNQQYRPYVTDPRYQQQPQYPDPRYNAPSYYIPRQIKPQPYYPRQPLNKQPVTAQAPSPTAYRPPPGAYPTRPYPNQYIPRQRPPTVQAPPQRQPSPNFQVPTTNKAPDQNQGESKSSSDRSTSYKSPPPPQAPVIVDPYTGQEYYQVPGILPPFTDKLNQLSLELLNTSQGSPTPPLHPQYSQPINSYPQPTRGILPEMDDDAQEETLQDRMELLRLLNAQGNNINPNSPELSTLLHHMMQEGELEFDDDDEGMLPPTINPTATLTDTTAYDYQPVGEYPNYSQAPYWFQGSHHSDAQGHLKGHHQGNIPINPQGHDPENHQDLIAGRQSQNHKEWHMHPSAPGILTSNPVTHTPPLQNQKAANYPFYQNPSITAPPSTIKPTPNLREIEQQRRQQQLKAKQRIEYLMTLKKKLERFAQLRKQLQQRAAQSSTPATATKAILRAPAATNPQQAVVARTAIKQTQQKPPNQPNPSASKQGPQSGGPAVATESPIPPAGNNAGQKVQAALLNQEVTTSTPMGSAGNFSAIAMVAEPGMSKSEVTGVIIGTLLGIVVVLVPLLCLLMRYRKHLKLKRKRFFPRPYSKRSDASRGSHDAMDTMVYSELGKQTLAFDSDGNGNGPGNQESDYLVSLPGSSINASEAIYNNNLDNQGNSHVMMSLTSSKRADSVEISRLLTLRESEQKPKVPDATKRPALPVRGHMKETLQQHGSLQMLH